MKVKGVIFDMDGTITAPYFDFAKIKDEAGIGDVDMLDYLRFATGEEYDRVRAILARIEDAGVANAKLNRGGRKLLSFLAKRKIPIALLTRNSRKSVAGVCRRLKLRFDISVTREDGPHKPAPEPILRIARQWPCALLVNGNGEPEWVKDADYIITKLTDVIAIVEGKKQ
jgi:beta-phosphoglucomutase-like phosphatase (HAD superfamily)